MKLAPALCAFLVLCACSVRQAANPGLAESELSLKEILSLPTSLQLYHKVFSVKGVSATESGEGVERTTLFAADYEIRAGVDASALHLVAQGPGSVAVYLPRARILSVTVVPRPVHQYFVAFRSTWLVGQVIESGDRRDIAEAIPEIERSPAMVPIIEQAQANAETTIEAFLKGAGYSNIVFVVPPAVVPVGGR